MKLFINGQNERSPPPSEPSSHHQVVKAEPREMCDVELGGRDEDSEEEKPGTETAAQHRFYGHRIGENIYFLKIKL